MDPVEIDESVNGYAKVVYAKNQPQYRALPALRNAEGRVLSRWRPTLEELTKLIAGEDLYLEVLTFNQPLQPVILGVWSDKVACVDGSPT